MVGILWSGWSLDGAQATAPDAGEYSRARAVAVAGRKIAIRNWRPVGPGDMTVGAKAWVLAIGWRRADRLHDRSPSNPVVQFSSLLARMSDKLLWKMLDIISLYSVA